MLLLIALPIGIALGLITGGRVQALSGLRLRYLPLFFVSLGVQVSIFSDALAPTPWILEHGPWLYVASLLALVAAIAANLRLPGMKLVLIGAAANLAVIVANGGQMPVAMGHANTFTNSQVAAVVEDASRLGNTAPATEQSRLVFLGDILATPEGFPLPNVFSVGDLLVAVGVARLLWRGTHWCRAVDVEQTRVVSSRVESATC